MSKPNRTCAEESEMAIQVEGLTFSYDGINIVEDVTFDLKTGDILGIIGPNGGGKSTLLKILLGLLPQYKGTAQVLCRPARDHHRGGCCIGYVPQRRDIQLNFPVLVEDVAEMGFYTRAKILRKITAEEKRFVQEMLERVGMAAQSKSSLGELSGGQQQRVFIARALVSRPKLLFLDEPTTGIDPKGQHQFLELISSLRDEMGLTILIVSHDLRVVATCADTVICLNKTLHCHASPDVINKDVLLKTYSCDFDVYSNLNFGD